MNCRVLWRLTVVIALVLAVTVLAEPSEDIIHELGMRPPRNGSLYVIAHRGAHREIPENTLAAYAKAIELGCDFVEVDLRTTKDGRIVSVHNANVDAYTSDAAGRVRDFTLAELKAMDIGSRVNSRWSDERIPTFEEILELCRGRIGIYLDLKNAELDPLLNLIRRYQMEKDIVWYASSSTLRKLQEQCPQCIPMPDPGLEKNLGKMFASFDAKPKVVASVWRTYSPGFVSWVHEHNALVFVDESDATCWADALAWGSDGIQTDDPEGLIRWLESQDSGDGGN